MYQAITIGWSYAPQSGKMIGEVQLWVFRLLDEV